MVGAALNRSEPSHRFAFNGIHTKSGAENLQGNGLGKGPGASQIPIRRGSQNMCLSNSITPSFEMREHTHGFSSWTLFLSQKSIIILGFPYHSIYRKTPSFEMTKMPLTLSDDRLHAFLCVMESSHTTQNRGTIPNLLSL